MMTTLLVPDNELMAITLEADANYRVLRRYKPRTRFKETQIPAEDLGRGVILDTETTGREPLTDRIIELGLVSFTFQKSTGEPIEVTGTYNALEDPGMPIDPSASRVNGITSDMVKGQKIDDGKVEEMASEADLVIAHNSSFDREFCEYRWAFMKDLSWACSRSQVDWDVEGITGTKLDYIAYRLGFFYDAHRADADCMALLEVLARPLPVSGTCGLTKLLGRFDHKEIRLWATDSPFEKKGMLSARGYKWGDGTNGKEKAWFTTLPQEQVQDEIAWLRHNIYGRPGRVVLDSVDARCRFSPRRLDTRTIRFV